MHPQRLLDRHAAGQRRHSGLLHRPLGAFPDANVSPLNVIGSRDLIAVESVISGTNKGELPPPLDLPATNRKIELGTACFVTLRNGKIAVDNVYCDYGSMLEQLGIVPKEVEFEAEQEREVGR